MNKLILNNQILSEKIKIANSFDERLVGLMFKKEMSELDGLLITPCNSIHTFFMRFNIDVYFLDKNNKVIKIIKKLKPWRITGIYFKAIKVLELRENFLEQEVNIGDKLEVVCLK